MIWSLPLGSLVARVWCLMTLLPWLLGLWMRSARRWESSGFDHSFCTFQLAVEASFYGLEGDQQLPVPRITEYASSPYEKWAVLLFLCEQTCCMNHSKVSVWQHKDDTSIYVDCLEQTIREECTGPWNRGGFKHTLGCLAGFNAR